jgi:hypothetical protein
LARKLRDETPELVDPPNREPTALGAVILAAAAVEAAVNHSVERTFPPRDFALAKLPIQHLARERVDRERPPFKKLKLLAFAMEVTVEWDAEPWRSLPELSQLRNALVHFDASPVRTSEKGTLFEHKHLRELARRLDLWRLHERGATWLEVFLNRPCADWAVRSADAVLRSLDSPPWIRTS